MKKLLTAAFVGLTILMNGACASKGNAMKEIEGKNGLKNYLEKKIEGNATKEIEGKDGLFAIMDTTQGEIALELYYKDAPLTVCNFVGLAEGTLDASKGKAFYDGLKFHRVIADFMIQGGDPRGNGTGGPGYKFADEPVPYKFDKPGYLAMANAGANTNGSQFFITHVPTDWLNGKHTIFGHVVSDEDQKVVNKVQQGDEIKSVKIVRNGDEAKAFKCTQAEWDELSNAIKEKAEAAKKAALGKVIEGCTKSADGIYYKTTKNGSGSKVGKGKNVSVEYKGYLVNGTLFDASFEFDPRGHEALEFTTAAGMMIPGFDEMVQDMKVGEIRTMVIPPELAYGDRGIPQAGIEGGAYICFDVDLKSAK